MTDLSDPQMGELHYWHLEDTSVETNVPNLKETWLGGYFVVTKRGDPLPLWWRLWARVFFNYKWERI